MSLSQLSPPDTWSGTAEGYREWVAATLEKEHRKCATDPWYFIKHYLLTEDPQDLTNPYKPFPERNYPYLKACLDEISTEPLLAIEKSRQVMVSWLMCAYVLWLILFHSGVNVYVQSKKQEDADLLLDRIALMYRSLPRWLAARHPVKITDHKIRTRGTRSEARAIPQGADVVRGKTPTLWWNDETAAQSDCPAAWKAARQALAAGKGRAVFTSSAAQGWFHMLISDKLEHGDPISPTDHRELCFGLTRRRLSRNRFVVLRLHYTADPEKRTPEWIASARAGTPEADWQQEMEINYAAKSGAPALPQYMLYRDRLQYRDFEIPAWWPRIACADYGFRSPYACYFIAIAPDGNAYIYWEYYAAGLALKTHLDVIKAHPDFPLLSEYILDASCWAKNQQRGDQVNSIAELHEEMGVFPVKARVVQDTLKVQAWNRAWADVDKGVEPTVRIATTCVSLDGELPGIVWHEHSEHVQRTKNVSEKLVDRDNHAFDAVSYFLLHHYQGGVEPAPELPPDVRAQLESARLRVQDLEAAVARQRGVEEGHDPTLGSY